ncbi:hypothetical protein BG53_14375 [Paenibacillus darwinianus]|uniref:Uncharacterized protein n=1 Tax=Paenibacillus darwinianus TaxID=1380763 RepID=A0A9W5S2N4_9BACL|nr:hypothetical protein CH50_08525 [Paenibacillus darwinianus]EXX89182.1 hypothetical protein BG52_00275 [Paenibacillus darwinianus]EXX90047.1 hypothetical protein BG53_14375 [Paenibacillus darwinianus]
MASFANQQLKAISGISTFAKLLHFLQNIGTKLILVFFCKSVPMPMLIKEDSFQHVRFHTLTLPKTKIRRKTSPPKIYKFWRVKKADAGKRQASKRDRFSSA